MAYTPWSTRRRRAGEAIGTGLAALGSAVSQLPKQVGSRILNPGLGSQDIDKLPVQKISQFDISALQSQVGSFEAFNQYASKRDEASWFSDIKVGDKAIKDSGIDFIGIRTLTDATQEARNTFNEKATAFNELLLNPNGRHPRAFVAFLHELKQKAMEAIQKQHEHELSELARQFEDKDAIKDRLGIDDAAVDQLKTDMTQALKGKQAEELTAFEEDLNKPINALHKELQKEGARITFIGNLARVKRLDMADEIKRVQMIKEEEAMLAARASASDDKGKTTLITASSEGSLKDIKPFDLEFMRSLTGRKIKVNKQAGTLEISMPHQWLDPLYYEGRMNQMQTDLRMLAQGIKASGHDSITMSIIQPQNEEFARKLAREAYLACRMEGFDHEKISMNVNGTKYSGDELIQKLGVDKDGADKLAAPKAEERERAITGPGVVSAEEMHELREEVEKIRANTRKEETKRRSPESEEAAAGALPSPGG